MVKYKCLYCGKLIEAGEEYSRSPDHKARYAHNECIKNQGQLRALIKRYLDPAPYQWKIINSQIDKYISEGMTYQEMCISLVYAFGLKRLDPSKSKGIGIIPYIKDEAMNTYDYDKMLKEKAQIQINVKPNYVKRNVAFIPHKRKIKKINYSSDDEGKENLNE